MAEPNEATLGSLAASIQELRRQVRVERKGLGALAPRLARIEAGVARLLALDDEAPDPGARLDLLAGVLDAGRIAAHVESAIRRAEVIELPVPHTMIPSFLPMEVYRAAVGAVPARVYFSGGGHGRLHLQMPPSLAPLHSAIAWRFLTDIATTVIAPAIVTRFAPLLLRHLGGPGAATGDAVRFVASHGRLVIGMPGHDGRERRARSSPVLMVAIALADSEPRSPFPPNTCRAVFDPGTQEDRSVPGTASTAGERLTYEFPIGLGAAHIMESC